MVNLLCLDSNGVLTGKETLAERLTRKYNPRAADDFRRYSSGALPLPKGDGAYALARRVAATHRGILREDMKEGAGSICPTEGARAIVKKARELGYEVAIISADYAVAAGAVAGRLGVSRFYGNVPRFDGDAHSGELVEPIIIGDRKAEIVRGLKKELQPRKVVAVVDSLVDVPMLQEADAGIFCGGLGDVDRLENSGCVRYVVRDVEQAIEFL